MGILAQLTPVVLIPGHVLPELPDKLLQLPDSDAVLVLDEHCGALNFPLPPLMVHIVNCPDVADLGLVTTSVSVPEQLPPSFAPETVLPLKVSLLALAVPENVSPLHVALPWLVHVQELAAEAVGVGRIDITVATKKTRIAAR
jgi:hypothetical protein